MRSFLATLSILLPLSAWAGSYPVTVAPTPFYGSRLYLPNDGTKHPAVIMLHGSEGGSEHFLDSEATILATQGYAVLMYCYFDCNRSPIAPRKTLKNVEATGILDAVAWLRSQPKNNGKVVVYGFSRGAEFAMITGSLRTSDSNKPDALIAHSPSDVFNGPFNWSWREPACWLCKAGQGKCNESSPQIDFSWNPSCGPDDPTRMDFSRSAWKIFGATVLQGERIEIEKFGRPILITVGEKDEVWPVDQTHRIEATLKAAGQSPEIHYFPNQGHVFRGVDEQSRREIVLTFLQQFK